MLPVSETPTMQLQGMSNMNESTGSLLRIGGFFQSRPCMLQVIVCLGPGHSTSILPDLVMA